MADQKITQLTELTTVDASDLLAIVDDPSGTPVTKKITVANLVGSNSIINNEVPSGTINSSNTAFTLANTPVTGSVSLYLDGVLQKEGAGNDYTISGANITYLTAPITGSNLLANYLLSGVASSNADTLDGQHGSYYAVATESASGWIPLGACTYESSDDPTYTFSFASDMTSTLSAGMRIKLTDSGVQYFIITAVGAFSGGKTIITGYGGTDYNLSGGAITNPYYSTHKAPQGLPLNPSKWSVVVNSTTQRSQGTPAQNTWYNAESINVPIGDWNVEYNCFFQTSEAAAGAYAGKVTLSTANNSESDVNNTCYQIGITTGASTNVIGSLASKSLYLTLAAKATYYLNMCTNESGIDNIYIRGDRGVTVIRATCSYL